MKNTTYYIVKFNDSYGTGFDTSYETLLESKEDFNTWLNQHNAKRIADLFYNNFLISDFEVP